MRNPAPSLLCSFLWLIAPVAHSNVIYVKTGATGLGDGSSWSNAFTDLQPAIAAATNGDQVWIAEGIYTPTSWPNGGTAEREKHFSLKSGVSVYGGFAGDETNLADRDSGAHLVVLSGDIDANDADSDGDGISDPATTSSNSFHVFYHPVSIISNAALDSVTICGGRANGSGPRACGGGLYNSNASPSIANCTIEGNSALWGGGIYNWSSFYLITNSAIKGNSAGSGGGIYNDKSSSPTLNNCTLEANAGRDDGGAIQNENSSSSTLNNCTLEANAAGYGGAICNENSSSSTLNNCTLHGNTCSSAGGAIYNSYSSASLYNCTLEGNSAADGGAIYNFFSSVTLNNSILWGNLPQQIFSQSSSSTASHCIIQGSYSGTQILSADPLLLPLGTYGGSTRTMPPRSNSPAINTGVAPGAPAIDQRGFPRDDFPDIGACEWNGSSSITVIDSAENTSVYCAGFSPTLRLLCEATPLSVAWYYGLSGDTSIPVPGISGAQVALPAITEDASVWARTVFFFGQVDSAVFAMTTTPSTIHVTTSGDDSYDGASWVQAKRSPREAIADAGYGAQVWVAEGTYRPNDFDRTNLNRIQSFFLKKGVSIYGGFAGVETELEERNPGAHPTILSGDLGRDDVDTDGDGRPDANVSENAYHVFHHPQPLDLDATARLDSVTIRGGRANGSQTSAYGGAICNSYFASPTLSNCTLEGNSASSYGGAIYNQLHSSPTLNNCTIAGNSASYGGAIFNDYSSPTLNNSTFQSNSASSAGGVIYGYRSSPTFCNCTLAGNSAADGGAIYNNVSSATLKNCVLWNNPQQQLGGWPATASYCIIQGGYSGTQILTNNPLLLAFGDHGGPTPTMPVSAGSAAIDAGLATGSPSTDQRGFPRHALPDIGACEFQALALVSDVSNPTEIGSHFTLRAISDINGASFQWFGRQSGNTWDPIDGGTNGLFATSPLDLGLDLWVRVTGQGTNFDSAVQSIEVRGTYPEWVAFHGLAGADAETGASPSGDGVPNLIKYASGLDPNQNCSRGEYGSFYHDGASNKFSLVWCQSKTPTDLNWSFRKTTNLLNWAVIAGSTNLVQSGTGYDLWEATVPIGGPRLFLDVRVDLVSP